MSKGNYYVDIYSNKDLKNYGSLPEGIVGVEALAQAGTLGRKDAHQGFCTFPPN